MFIKPFLMKSLLINLVTLMFLTGCQEDLFPESQAQPNGPGQVGETVSDFNSELNSGDEFQLNQRLADTNADAVVFYFTMWCTVCDSHVSVIKNSILPNYTNVEFILVDYVSSSNSYSRASQQSSGFTDFDTIVDKGNQLEDALSATMGSIVVIDKNSVVQLNEYFNNSQNLIQVLNQL